MVSFGIKHHMQVRMDLTSSTLGQDIPNKGWKSCFGVVIMGLFQPINKRKECDEKRNPCSLTLNGMLLSFGNISKEGLKLSNYLILDIVDNLLC